MGLDMWCFGIPDTLVESEEQVDVNIFDRCRRTIGFERLTDEQIDALSDADRSAYFSAFSEAERHIVTNGLLKEVCYWRKFNALHGWFQRLYDEKGGVDPEFNCATVRIDEAVLNTLQHSVHSLAPTPGYFFGAQTVDPDDLETVQPFIDMCRVHLAQGRALFYYSWW